MKYLLPFILIFSFTHTLFGQSTSNSEYHKKLDSLVNKLYQKDSIIALDAFEKLTDYPPDTIQKLLTKYNLGHVNTSINYYLPTFSKRFLMQLTKLKQFCKENKFPISLSPEIQSRIDHLRIDKMGYSERYFNEDTVISLLTINEVTGIEFMGAVYENYNWQFNFSVGRILDKWYSKNFELIINDPNQLRLYVKKSVLFKGFGIIGVCGKYLAKLQNLSKDDLNRVSNLLKSENDQDIIYSIRKILAINYQYDDLEDFLKNIEIFSFDELKKIKINPTKENLLILSNYLNKETSEQNLYKTMLFIRDNADISMVPFFISQLDNYKLISSKENSHVNDYIVSFLEKIFRHSFNPNEFISDFDIRMYILFNSNIKSKNPTAIKWRQEWEKDSINYKTWGLKFYNERLNKFLNKDSLTAYEINSIVGTPYYNDSDTSTAIQLIFKTKSCFDNYTLHIPENIIKSSALSFFKKCKCEYNVSAKIINASLILPFSEVKSLINVFTKDYTPGQKVDCFLDVLYHKNFRDSLLKKENVALRNEIINILQNDNMKQYGELDFERSQGYMLLLKYGNLPLEKSLKAMNNAKSKGKTFALNSILSEVTFNELCKITDIYDELKVEKFDKERFFSDDFGIYIEKYEPQTPKILCRDIKRMSEKDLYLYYLKKAGYMITKRHNELDLYKIYEILKFDNVEAFAGGGGSKRDLLVSSVIRILELEFGTVMNNRNRFSESFKRMGSSLNNQTKSWMEYLIQNHLVNPPDEPPSFIYYDAY